VIFPFLSLRAEQLPQVPRDTVRRRQATARGRRQIGPPLLGGVGAGTRSWAKRDDDRVIQEVNQTIKSSAAPAGAYYNRANIFYGTRDYDQATKYYNQAIKLSWTTPRRSTSAAARAPSSAS
jgi:tetratricopeptide (TPR) repeat protein